MGRAWRKQRKAEARLGPDGARRKGMHGVTYARILEVIDDCEGTKDRALATVIARWGFPNI